MLTLGFDTATGWGCLGLIRDGTVLAETGWRVERNQAEQFLPVLAEMVARTGLVPAEIDLIAAGCGPGSYTGLRIGLAIAEALSFSLGRPVTGVSTLAALAANGAGFPGLVCPMLTSRRGEIYAAAFQAGQEVIPPGAFAPPALLARLLSFRIDRVLVLGSGTGLMAPYHRAEEIHLIFGHAEQHLLRGSAVARLGTAKPGEPARPVYLRRTEAEERMAETGERCQ